MLEPQSLPTEDIQLSTPSDSHERTLKDDDPGIILMTDFRRTVPYQIHSSALLSEVKAKMIACGVRLLFVIDSQDKFIGVITQTDLSSEKPLLFSNHTSTAITDVTAQDIMTPLNQLEAVPLNQVMKSKISDIVELQKKGHLLHILVLDTSENKNRVCGLLSITRTSQLLGIDLSPSLQAQGFSEINQALSN